MISARYAFPVALLIVGALVPTVAHSYLGLEWRDGRRASALPTVLAGMTSVPSGRHATWGKRRFDSDDWIERSYTAADGETVKLFVGRSYDAKKLYHHPELAVAYGTEYQAASPARFDVVPGVPIYVLHGADGSSALAVYALHHGNGFVENPYVYQIRVMGELLFSGRKPMTLFFVQSTGIRGPLEGSVPVRLLGAAIERFIEQEPSTSPSAGRPQS
jgi:hypothetical protein